jgi:hypothetical protein
VRIYEGTSLNPTPTTPPIFPSSSTKQQQDQHQPNACGYTGPLKLVRPKHGICQSQSVSSVQQPSRTAS